MIQIRQVAIDPDRTAPALNLTTREGMVNLLKATPDGMIMTVGGKSYAFSRDSLVVIAYWLLATAVDQGAEWSL
jgi:hypothetical protein